MEGSKYEIYRDDSFLNRFRLISSQGEVLLISEPFRIKDIREEDISYCQSSCAEPSNFIKRDSSRGKYYFVLMSSDKKVVGISPIYSSKTMRDNAMATCQQEGVAGCIERAVAYPIF
ncbi:MAG: DUF1508 domain-containing protein [Candidatus Cyclobacteriaceae bacterium M2_1C_046]